ncbi:MAG TPA: SDR family oxidoreductase [Elusimicrobiota bacterium]|jgi:NAD(P)-dependent dehydrogenase (short-subunit alcohol dehydrogenase family)|nr:SDR family oxidoreductase [Elusimicrobiota bacterium]
MAERKRALITGCSSGFGRDLAVALAERGWEVWATARDAARRGVLKEESSTRPGLRALDLDVTLPAQRAAAAAAVNGRLDLLVNNAGYGVFGALEDLSEKDLREQFETNFFGAALLTRELLPALRAARGRVVNVSSVVGYCAIPLGSAYCSSKFALEGLSESLYHELAPHGVQVSLVEPGRFRTRFGDNVRWGAGSKEPTSAYRAQTDAYARSRERASGTGVSGGAVVEAVLRLAESRRMPLRVRVGADAKAAYWTRKLLPARLADAILSAAYRRVLGGK